MKLEKDDRVVGIDLPGIYAFIAKADVAAAERVLDAIDQTILDLARHPESGVIYPTKPARVTEWRMIPVTDFANYLIFYTVGPDFVRILYVVHGARDLPTLFRKDRRS